MKKNIMISLSVVLAILILIVPSKEIKAYEIDYNGVKYDTEVMYQALYNKYYSTSPSNFKSSYYQLAFEKDNKMYFVLFPLSAGSCVKLNENNLDTCSGSNVVKNEDFALSFATTSVGLGISTYNQAFAYIVDKITMTEDFYHYKRTNSDYIVIANNEEVSQYNPEYLLNSKILYSNFNFYYDNALGDEYVYHYSLDIPYFNKTYSSAEYSKIEVLFNDFPLTSLGVDLELDLSVGSVIENNQSGFNFSSPYLEFEYNIVTIDESGMIITSAERYKEIIYVSDISSYKYNYNINKKIVPGEPKNDDKIYSSIKLVIPFDSSNSQDIKVSLSSNLEYELTEYTNEEFSYNLTSLDLTNKKGAMLVTKDVNSMFSANFEVDGYFYLEFRNNLSHSNFDVYKIYTYGFCDELLKENKDYNCSLSNKFSHVFGYDNPYRVLYFRNLNNINNSSSTIYYDSTKFDVYVIDNESSNVIIKDPVSGEDIYFDIDIYEQTAQAEVDVKYLLNLINKFLDENENASDFVKEVLLLFFTKMPTEIYQAFITILFVIFIGAIIIIVGWK